MMQTVFTLPMCIGLDGRPDREGGVSWLCQLSVTVLAVLTGGFRWAHNAVPWPTEGLVGLAVACYSA